jgi:hypothetical protein
MQNTKFATPVKIPPTPMPAINCDLMWKPTKSQVVTYNFIDIIKVIFHLDSSEYCEKIL